MLREKALELLRSHSRFGIALENHCVRLAEFAAAIARNEGFFADIDLLYAMGYLHDIGLCVTDPTRPNYLQRGLHFAAAHMANWGVTEEELAELTDALLYNHSLRPIPGIQPHAELIRRAVQIEHSLGRWSNGLQRDRIAQIFETYPRGDFNRVLLEFFRITLRDGSPIELFRLFFPRNEHKTPAKASSAG